MESEQRGDIDIGNSVAVSEAEGLFVLHMRQVTLEAAASHGGSASVDQGDTPGLRDVAMHLHLVVQDVDGDIGSVEIVVGEILFDEIALVAQTDDEVVDAVVGVGLHDMPQDRAAAYFHHRLGPKGGLFTEPGTKTAGENNSLHSITLQPRHKQCVAAKSVLCTRSLIERLR